QSAASPSDASTSTPQSDSSAPHSPLAVSSTSLMRIVGLAFLGGIILNLMPCVFPVLSLKAAALAGHGGEPEGASQARVQALAFLVGVVATFLGLAGALIAARAAGAAVGWGFQLQSPAIVAGLCLVMLAAALNLSGLFEIGTSLQGLGSGLAARGGLTGSFFTGVLSVAVAAPCTAPFMGPALGFALTASWPVGLAVFLALALGFAAPFTLIAFSPPLIRALPRPGAWMETFRHILAFPMYAAAAWLAWVLAQQGGPEGLARLLAAGVLLAFAAWLFGRVQSRRAAGARPLVSASAAALAALAALVAAFGAPYAVPSEAGAATVEAGVPSKPWSPDAVAQLQAQGRPVLVNFTAAWCVTCQVNERVVFATPQVAAAFKASKVAYLVADWTNRDATIAKALEAQGRDGVPLYLLYDAKGDPPRVLPQLLTPDLVAHALAQAAAGADDRGPAFAARLAPGPSAG
ncbi:MAG: thioredoxin family protein, partial [Alphaproteobacteria bacterium]|nr:thioredoxin family protein [Alphaproteobacteria bacterium]